jgi:transcriptional regulator with XRE-family HTH domain
MAGVERAHVGKIERGQHLPTLGAALKIAKALGMSGAELLAEAEALLPVEYRAGG